MRLVASRRCARFAGFEEEAGDTSPTDPTSRPTPGSTSTAGQPRARQYSQVGSFMAGSANSGAHAANGLAALFIATGQDAATIAESHAGIVYTQLLESGDYYWSITLPALIVATVGGGTGLATQRECLAMLGCHGPGTVGRFAEICAAVVLAGEVSLSSAVLAGDWDSSHERLGRNR